MDDLVVEFVQHAHAKWRAGNQSQLTWQYALSSWVVIAIRVQHTRRSISHLEGIAHTVLKELRLMDAKEMFLFAKSLLEDEDDMLPSERDRG